MKLGEIYKTKFDERIFRIIGLDNFEVFYDCLSNENKWTFSGNFKRKSIFFRMEAELFKIKSELIKREEFTEKEAEYFRADLPMRFGRIKNLSWNSVAKSELNKYQNEFSQRKVNADKIILIPSRSKQKGGFLKGELIESNSILTEFEIIQKASELQKISSNGIGFYRMGCQKGIPTYSIGEYLDKAGIMK